MFLAAPALSVLASLVLIAAAHASTAADPPADADRDGDGITDFHEVHKHFTDPAKRDTDGDGKPDGDWDERREHAYTVRSVVRVLPPVTEDVLCDDYQDARIRRETKQYVELEVIHYPLNTVADAIVADPDWRRSVAARKELRPFLEPGITSNFDAAMSEEIAAALLADGIDAKSLDDRSLVEKTARWLLDHTEFRDGFTTFCSTFPNGKAKVLPGLEDSAARGMKNTGLTLEQQWERELFAKGMWKHRVHGSCTSSAIFWNGCLRALGVPTRIILCIPVCDSSDPKEMAQIDALANHRVRRIVARAIAPLGNGWSSHTFNEVFVGGRWRRLNYDRLGQNILDPNCFGLMTHVATFSDWSDGEMAKTWGRRQKGDPGRDDPFGGSNPYSCVELSDEFGAHARIDNPELPEHRVLTIDRLTWWSSPQRTVEMDLVEPQTSGHLVAHVREVFPEEDKSQFAEFFAAVDKRFVLRARGREDVPLQAERGGWFDPKGTLRDYYLRIAAEDVPKVAIGVAYQLVPLDTTGTRRWAVAEGVTITREDESTPFAPLAPKQDATGSGDRDVVTLTLDATAWSDDPLLPDMFREAFPDEPHLLARVKEWSDFEVIRRLTQDGDTRFFLEADGHPTLKIGVGVGGFTYGQAGRQIAWVVLPFGRADRRDFVEGVEYRLLPQNSKPGWQWIVEENVRVLRKPPSGAAGR